MINNFKDNPVAAAYVAMYEKQTAVDELEEATDLTKVSTDKLQAMWNSHKDEERPSPALAAQLKKISAELAQRKKSNMKERADWVPEEISDEGVADFMGAAAAAAKKGDKTFKFGDKEYKVTMKKSTADAIDEDEVGYQDRYAVKDGKAVKDNPKSSSDKDQPYHVYADSPAHAVRKYAKESKTIGEGYSPQEIKQAIGIASDKRYAGGNMTGATSAIEKLKAGLSDHPQVKAVLKSKNEEVDLKEMTVDKAIANATSASMSDMATEIKKYATKYAGIDKAVFLRTAKLLDQGDMKGAIRYTLMQDTDPRDWLLTVMGITSIPRV